MEQRTLAITGATGNIGGVLAATLLSRGHRVRAIGRSHDRLQTLIDQGAEAWVGSLSDAEFLTRAFTGADAIFAMIPPNATAENFRAYQNEIGEVLATATKNASASHVVNLSSIGGQLEAGTGPIKGLHDNELRFNALENVSVLHLRPAYFMENLLIGIDIIKNMGVNGSGLAPHVAMPMIATRDIATFAAQSLEDLSFAGHTARELLGERDLTMTEATKAIGQAIGKAELKYVQFPYENVQQAMLGMGLSANVVAEVIEMYQGTNDGTLRGTEERSAQNTTTTTIEEFAETVFASAFKGAERAKSA